MGPLDFLKDLPVVGQRVKGPIWKGTARVEEVKASKREDAKESAAFRSAVWKRDGAKCRLCGVKVIRSLALVPNRGEVHHIRGRNVAPEDKTNPKAALLLCSLCHSKAQRHEVKVPKP